MLDTLKPPHGATRKRRRVGRGEGSGRGKTAGRGNKGLKARSGRSAKPGFEGGQMPLTRRLPKRGFRNIFGKDYVAINIENLERSFSSNETVSRDTLFEKGLIKSRRRPVKILGEGALTKALTVRADAFSAQAAEKIRKAGGSAETAGGKTPAGE
jgi:large subunit ribosomal protein L15